MKLNPKKKLGLAMMSESQRKTIDKIFFFKGQIIRGTGKLSYRESPQWIARKEAIAKRVKKNVEASKARRKEREAKKLLEKKVN